jgi:Thrombospondin type 3 repeat
MKRLILSAIGAGLTASLGVLLLVPSVPIQAQTGQTIINTFDLNTLLQPSCGSTIENGWSITRAYTATAQTITTPANNVLTDYRFELAPRTCEGEECVPTGGQAQFSVYQWGATGPTGSPLYTTTVDYPVSGGVVDITGINLLLTAGTQYGMTIDLLGYGGASVFFNCNRAGYAEGGNGWWTFNPVAGSWSSFPQFNHIFRAVYTSGDSDEDGVVDSEDNCPVNANPNQEDFDDDGVGDVCDNCAVFANEGQADSDEDGVGNACEFSGVPEGGGLTFPPGPNRQNEYTSPLLPGQDEPETLVLGFDQVINTLVCTVNFVPVLKSAETDRLAKINSTRAVPVEPLEYTTHDDVPRRYLVRYEVECRVDETNDGIGDRQAIPGQDYNGVDLAFTFHADHEDLQNQVFLAQERTLVEGSAVPPEVDGLPPGWDFEADAGLEQYDRLLNLGVAMSSCDCVGSASTTDISWFIAVKTLLEDPDGEGPAEPGDVELKVLSPPVRTIGGVKTFWNPFRSDGKFTAGLAVPIVVRLRNKITGAYITDPNVQPPSESGLMATVKRVLPGLDDNVALEGFLIWGDTGAFLIDPWRRGYYTYVWQTVQQDTLQPLPPGKYTVTIKSNYTGGEPFVVNLR